MDEIEKYESWIKGCVYVLEFHRTGSSYICDPPVTNTDVDYVCLVEESSKVILDTWLTNQGYTDVSKLYEGTDFLSVRKERLNLIIVWSDSNYEGWVEATLQAKELNLTNKEDRVALFKKVRNEVMFGTTDG